MNILATLSDRSIRRALNTAGSISGAAKILNTSSGTLAKVVRERRINWVPSAHTKAMMKAAQNNGKNRTFTPFRYPKSEQVPFQAPRAKQTAATFNAPVNFVPSDAPVIQSSNGTQNDAFSISVPKSMVQELVKTMILEGKLRISL